MSLYDKASIALIPSGTKASKLYSVLPANGDGDFTHSRGSTATRVNKDGFIESVAANVPRLDYPITNGVVGDCPHLLLEPSRTNKYPYSNQKVSGGLTTFTSGTASITVTNNYATSPDGSQNAMRMVATCGSTSSDQTGLRDALSMSAASATLSFYGKSNTSSNQTIAFHFNGGTKTVVTLTNEWQRFTYTDTSGTTNNAGVEIRGTYTNTSVDVLLFGFQMEQASYATSYIPTSGSTVTRSADACNGSGTSAEFNDSEGVLFVESEALANDETSRVVASISNGSATTNRIVLQYTNNVGGNQVVAFAQTPSGYSSVLTRSITNALTFNKFAVVYNDSTNNFDLWVNGTKIGDGSLSSSFTANSLTTIQLADGDATGNPFYGRIKQIIYFNEALSDSELATLTS